MRFLIVLVLVGCAEDPVVEIDAMPPVPPGVGPAPCADYQRIFTNDEPYWNHEPDWLSAAYRPVTVSGTDFMPFQGFVIGTAADTATVNVGMIYHFENGATQLGSFGRRTPGGLCEWAIAIE